LKNAETMRAFPISSNEDISRRANLGDSTQVDVVLKLFFVCFAALVITRLCVSGYLLNTVMNYSIDDRTVSSQASILAKLHPAAWGLFALAAVLAPKAVSGNKRDWPVILSILIFGSTVIFIALTSYFAGRAISLGYLFDSMILGCAASLIMLAFPDRMRLLLGHIILTVIVLNSIIALGEFATGVRFLPYPYDELVFRATALFGHPLSTGGTNATAICFIWLTKWSRFRKFLSAAILVAGCLAVGARAASVMTVGLGLVAFLAVGNGRDRVVEDAQIKAIVLLGILIALPILIIGADSLGLFERFQKAGIYDESAAARIEVFRLFDFIDWREFLFGVGVDTMAKYASLGLKILVENSVIVLIFQFGAILTFLLLASLLNVVRTLAAGAEVPVKLALLYFCSEPFLSSGFASKGLGIMLIFLLALAFRLPRRRLVVQSSAARKTLQEARRQ
jgi:hypothetical protein